MLFDDLSKEAAIDSSNQAVKRFEKSDNKQSVLPNMVYSLEMLISLLIKRRRFKGYGWTKFYDFNISDFKICLDIIKIYKNI